MSIDDKVALLVTKFESFTVLAHGPLFSINGYGLLSFGWQFGNRRDQLNLKSHKVLKQADYILGPIYRHVTTDDQAQGAERPRLPVEGITQLAQGRALE